MKKVDTIKVIELMPPNEFLLVKKIGMIEMIPVSELIEAVLAHKPERISPYHFIAVFCANYFAQAATMQGHIAARHRHGQKTIDDVLKCIGATPARQDLPFDSANDHTPADEKKLPEGKWWTSI